MQIKRLMLLCMLAALAAGIFMLNQLALEHYLYFFYWWYDIMMHFLGGLLIGGLAAWGALRFDGDARWGRVLIVTLVSIAAVGIGWEIFEYATGQYIGQESIVLDTAVDLVMDVVGAVAAAWSLYRLSDTKRETTAISESSL